MFGWLREEIQLKRFGYSDCSPSSFYKSQWFNNRWIYCLLKFTLFGYWFAWFVPNITRFPEELKSQYWIFLTDWGVVLVLSYLFFSFALVLFGAVRKSFRTSHTVLLDASNSAVSIRDGEVPEEDENNLRWFHIVVWTLFEVSFAGAITITFFFWTFLAENWDIFDFNNHAINTVIMFIDFVFNDIPIRILHFYHLSLLGVVYTFFSLILYWTGYNSAIYPILDWENRAGLAIGLTLGIIFVVSPILQILLNGLYNLKRFIRKKTSNQLETRSVHDPRDAVEATCENADYEKDATDTQPLI